MVHAELIRNIGPAVAPPWHVTCGTGEGWGPAFGVGEGLGVGGAVAIVALGVGDGELAALGAAPPQAVTNTAAAANSLLIGVSCPRNSSHLRVLGGRGPAALKPASWGPALHRHASKMRSSLRHPFLGSGRRCHESASDLEARHSRKPNEPGGNLIAGPR